MQSEQTGTFIWLLLCSRLEMNPEFQYDWNTFQLFSATKISQCMFYTLDCVKTKNKP